MATISASRFNISRTQNAVLTINTEREISFFLTNFSLPGMSIGSIAIANPFKVHNEPGNTLTYEDLEVECIINENFDNWKASVDWLKTGSDGYSYRESDTKRMTRKDGSIVLLTNNGNRFGDIRIFNMFPTNIGAVSFDMQDAEATPLTFSITFSYESYSVNFDDNAEI